MNIVGLPAEYCGFTIFGFPTELNAFTKFTFGCAAWRRSISDSSRLVKNFSTPFTGGAAAMGLVGSITVLPASVSPPASSSTSSAMVPFTASTTISPNLAASANEPTFAPPFCDT